MDGNRPYPHKVETLSNGEFDATSDINIEQLQRLVRLLDGSDVSEIEVRKGGEGVPGVPGMHLLLRKAKAAEAGDQVLMALPTSGKGATADVPKETKHAVTAPLVGLYHVWARPKGGALVAVGDAVKVGQVVGTIQSLNIINEVESHVAGRVSEIFVLDGQAVEYGQPLMTIDSSEEA